MTSVINTTQFLSSLFFPYLSAALLILTHHLTTLRCLLPDWSMFVRQIHNIQLSINNLF